MYKKASLQYYFIRNFPHCSWREYKLLSSFFTYTFWGEINRYIICQNAYSKSICLNLSKRLKNLVRLALAVSLASFFFPSSWRKLSEKDEDMVEVVGETGGEIFAKLVMTLLILKKKIYWWSVKIYKCSSKLKWDERTTCFLQIYSQ